MYPGVNTPTTPRFEDLQAQHLTTRLSDVPLVAHHSFVPFKFHLQ